jgi:hypothetical protein
MEQSSALETDSLSSGSQQIPHSLWNWKWADPSQFSWDSLENALKILHPKSLVEVYYNQPLFFSPQDVLVAASHFSNLIGLFTFPENQSPLTPSAIKGCFQVLWTFFLDCLTLKMCLIGCPKTSVNSYQPMLCNNPEEWRPQLHHSLSLKSCLSNFTGAWTGDFYVQFTNSSAKSLYCTVKVSLNYILLLVQEICKIKIHPVSKKFACMVLTCTFWEPMI